MLLDLAGDEATFTIGVTRLVVIDPLATLVRSPKLFLFLIDVVLDDRVRNVQDGLRGTIVLLEKNDLGIRKMLFEIENVLDVSLTKTVDALRIVADDADVLLLFGQVIYHCELQRVC